MIRLKQELKRIDQEELTTLVLATNRLDKELPYTVYFSDKKAVRTLAQNRYLWGVVYKTLEDSLGYDTEEIHEICKYKFSLRTIYSGDIVLKLCAEDGVYKPGPVPILEIPKSTRMMNTKEMTTYIDKIRRWAMDDLGVYIKQPNELDDEDYINAMEAL